VKVEKLAKNGEKGQNSQPLSPALVLGAAPEGSNSSGQGECHPINQIASTTLGRSP